MSYRHGPIVHYRSITYPLSKQVNGDLGSTSYFDQVLLSSFGQDQSMFNPDEVALNCDGKRNMGAKSKSHQPLQVVLGSQTIKAFVAAPKEFKVLGIVRMGMEFGLLATTASGSYVRVNGSTVKALSTDAVEEAIKVARSSGRGESYAASRLHSQSAAVAPAVIVRKRRRHIEAPEFRQEPAVNSPQHIAAA
jgi:hypothetical protein